MNSITCLADTYLQQKLFEIWGTEDEKSKYLTILTEYFQNHRLNPYKLAQNPIPSEQYWEDYFSKHPDLRPNHIVYYEGGDPTRALYEWREKNGIHKSSGKSDLGFSENQTTKETKNQDETQERFLSIAYRLVDIYFPSTDEVPSYKWSWQDE